MFERLRFYLRHALNDLRVNRRLSLFALLSIAAGVAAIVSLQTLGIMIGDTLTGNLRESNRGDISVRLVSSEDGPQVQNEEAKRILDEAERQGLVNAPSAGFMFVEATFYYLSEKGLQALQAWADRAFPGQLELDYGYSLTDPVAQFLGTGRGTVMIAGGSGAEATQLSPLLVDPDRYPFYGEVTSRDGTPLGQLLQGPTDVVLDARTADTLAVTAGDTVRIRGADEIFTVRGVVATEQEVRDPFSGVLVALFGFYYLDNEAIALFEDAVPQAETARLKIADPSRVGEVAASLEAAFPFLETTTTEDLARQYDLVARRIGQLVTIMGLVSLLIGSIGIMNTMQVVVRRRSLEIAVLKSLGLQAEQVTLLFLTEALLMGFFGSLAGILLGWGGTFLLKSIAEVIVAQELTFRLTVGPALNGLVVGTLVATIFGLVPTLSAGLIRPALVLRPSERVLPRAGLGRVLLALLVILVAISLVASTILGDLLVAVLVTVGAFAAAGWLYLILLLLIWLAGRLLPALGWVDLKIPMRQMLAVRTRAATTLLALVVGVFSLSLITLLADSVNGLLRTAVADVGGNVLITAPGEGQRAAIEQALTGTEGVENYTLSLLYDAQLLSLEDASEGVTLEGEPLRARIMQGMAAQIERFRAFGATFEEGELEEAGNAVFESFGGLEVRSELASDIARGRALTSADAGQAVTVLRGSDANGLIGMDVGDHVTLLVDGEPLTLEVVGITRSNPVDLNLGQAPFQVPEGLLELPAMQLQVWADVDEAALPAVRRELAGLRGAFVLETSVFTRLLEGLIGAFTAFPTLVAVLGLIVGGVVIANSVALSTLERRREIAVMKALGLQRERVLLMLLLENGVLGLLGGLVGVGIGLSALSGLLISTGALRAIPLGAALLLMLLCIGVALLAALSSAWEATGERPMNVLRYE